MFFKHYNNSSNRSNYIYSNVFHVDLWGLLQFFSSTYLYSLLIWHANKENMNFHHILNTTQPTGYPSNSAVWWGGESTVPHPDRLKNECSLWMNKVQLSAQVKDDMKLINFNCQSSIYKSYHRRLSALIFIYLDAVFLLYQYDCIFFSFNS